MSKYYQALSTALLLSFSSYSSAEGLTVTLINSFTDPVSIESVSLNNQKIPNIPKQIAPLKDFYFRIQPLDTDGNNIKIKLCHNDKPLTLMVRNHSGDLESSLTGVCENSNNIEGNCQLSWNNTDRIRRFNPTLSTSKSEVALQLKNNTLTSNINPLISGPNLKGDASKISILSYNVWGTKIYGSKKENERFAAIPAHVSGYDVLTLSETIDQKATTNILLPALKTEYPYYTKNYHSWLVRGIPMIVGSGLRVVSKYPILNQDVHYFHHCSGLQCFASKGVVYAKINKLGQVYHIFVSHTQSGDNSKSKQARLDQVQEIKTFIDSKNIPNNEPVIVAGDLNIDKFNKPDEYATMQTTLNTQVPSMSGWKYSFDSQHNHWAKGSSEYIDYILPLNEHLQPLKSFNHVTPLRSTNDDLWGLWDLSDHYAVTGTFEYAVNPKP